MKIINILKNTGKQITESKLFKRPQIKINQEDDVIQISSKKIQNKKPSKITIIKEIIKSKMVHIDKSKVNELEGAGFPEFLTKSQSIICEGIGIPKELYAGILPKEMNNGAAMYYDWVTNRIVINYETLIESKSYLFSGLRHEMEHQKQAFDVFRTEGLGSDAVKYFVKSFTDCAIKSNKAITSKEIQETNLDFSEYLEKYRQKIIKNMGIIPANSMQAKIAGEYFESFKMSHDNPASMKTALKTRTEQEAYFAGLIARIEYLAAKWFSL